MKVDFGLTGEAQHKFKVCLVSIALESFDWKNDCILFLVDIEDSTFEKREEN
jgi:hypothetical protein